MLETRAVWLEKYHRWQINVTINGVRRSFYSSTPGRAGRMDCERRAAAALDNGATHDSKLSNVWDEYYAYKKMVGASEDDLLKIESYGRLYIKPILGRRKISTIRSREWQQIMVAQSTERPGGSLSHKTLTNIRGVLRTFATWARLQEYAVSDVIMVVPSCAKRSKKVAIQPADIKRLFEVDTVVKRGKTIPEWYIHAFRFIIVNGLRRGECAGLRTEDVSDTIITIRRSINLRGEITEGKTVNAQRRIGLSSISASILQDQIRMKKAAGIVSPWLFCDPEGNMMSTNALYKEWHEYYAKQIGITCSLHELRHTFISAVKSDMPTALLQTVVGHSEDTNSIGIYGHEFGQDLERAAEIVDQVFGKLTHHA